MPEEHALGLPGYPGGTDIAGNDVNSQFQLDGFGEALQLLAVAARDDLLDADDWRAAEVVAEAIADRWQEPDSGIWELPPRRWTHSRLTGAAGLRAIADQARPERGPLARARRRADGRGDRTRRAPDRSLAARVRRPTRRRRAAASLDPLAARSA